MVGAELLLEAVGGLAERARHHTGVVHQHVQPIVTAEKAIGEGAHARQRCQLDRLHAHTRVAGTATDRVGDSLALGDITRREDHFGAVRCERPGRLLADSARAAGDEYSLAGEIDALEHLVGGGGCAERRWVTHGSILRHGGTRTAVTLPW